MPLFLCLCVNWFCANRINACIEFFRVESVRAIYIQRHVCARDEIVAISGARFAAALMNILFKERK